MLPQCLKPVANTVIEWSCWETRACHRISFIMSSSLIISKIRYSLPVLGCYVGASYKKQISAILRRSFECCFTGRLWDFDCLLHEVDSQLFKSQYFLDRLLPDTRNTAYFTRRRKYLYELPYYHYSRSQCSFGNRSKYNFIWCVVL